MMTKKVLLSGSSYLEILGVDPSSPRTVPCSETNDLVPGVRRVPPAGAWPYGGMARLATPGKGSDGGRDQLPISSERSIVASVSAGQQVRRKTYYNL